jgi:HEAT repeat protein
MMSLLCFIGWGWMSANATPKTPRQTPKATTTKKPTPRKTTNKTSPQSVTDWGRELLHPNVSRRKAAMRQLERYGARAIPAMPWLFRALQDKHWQLRKRAAILLTKTGLVYQGTSATPQLLKRLKDPQWQVRAAFVEALGLAPRHHHKTIQRALRDLASDPIATVRERVATCFGRLHQLTPTSVQLLLQFTQDGAWPVRSAAIWSIQQQHMQDTKSIQLVGKTLRDPEPTVRHMAAMTLERMGHRATEVLIDNLRHPISRQLALQTLRPNMRLQPRHLTKLTALLADKDPRLQEAAALALARLGTSAAKAIPSLTKQLGNPKAYVRTAVILAFRQLGQTGVPALAKALHHKDKTTKQNAATALSMLGPKAHAATIYLVDTMLDTDWRIRREAAWALYRMGPAIRGHIPQTMLPILLNGLHDKLWKIRFCLVHILGQLGSKAKIVVGWFGPKAVSTLGVLKRLQTSDPDPRVRRAAKRALQQIQSP